MGCWCARCDTRRFPTMHLCPSCGNKRCPKATAHWLDCTGSNAPEQDGSDYGSNPATASPPIPVPAAAPVSEAEVEALRSDLMERFPGTYFGLAAVRASAEAAARVRAAQEHGDQSWKKTCSPASPSISKTSLIPDGEAEAVASQIVFGERAFGVPEDQRDDTFLVAYSTIVREVGNALAARVRAAQEQGAEPVSLRAALADLVVAVANMRVPQTNSDAALLVMVTIGPALQAAQAALAAPPSPSPSAARAEIEAAPLTNADAAAGFLPIGQPVLKHTGHYHPPGEVRGYVATKAGKTRVVVEHAFGMLHIYAPEQIRPAEPVQELHALAGQESGS